MREYGGVEVWGCGGLDVKSRVQGCREAGVRGVVVWGGELLFEISQRRISNRMERREDTICEKLGKG